MTSRPSASVGSGRPAADAAMTKTTTATMNSTAWTTKWKVDDATTTSKWSPMEDESALSMKEIPHQVPSSKSQDLVEMNILGRQESLSHVMGDNESVTASRFEDWIEKDSEEPLKTSSPAITRSHAFTR